jgi:hypothetical protein
LRHAADANSLPLIGQLTQNSAIPLAGVIANGRTPQHAFVNFQVMPLGWHIRQNERIKHSDYEIINRKMGANMANMMA